MSETTPSYGVCILRQNLGEKKISSMMESKDFRKGIVQLEWEHKRMTMEMEDLQNKMRDIQNLKVTREIQAVSPYLSSHGWMIGVLGRNFAFMMIGQEVSMHLII
jgi:type VI protein secretion system component Hcp